MAVLHSQLDPLPSNLPFRLVSKTIARGAYASIRKAAPVDSATPVFAVKFIHKDYAVRNGRITPKQIAMEVTLHRHIGLHQNIIQYFSSGEDAVWRWIAMEFAEGGDLFDKVEADVGVNEDIAHFYFSQLVSGVGYMHSKGVGHRDIKPENILMSSNGSLKLADFGLATLFSHKGTRKLSNTMCGSPPYVAPEVVTCGKSTQSRHKTSKGYAPDQVDVWSCGVVLFVLLVGNTPWDEPSTSSWEFNNYLENDGRSTDELWQKVPAPVSSLLRGMMKIDPAARFTFEEVRRHPWFARSNPYLTAEGKIQSPMTLATQMLEGLKIDFSQEQSLTPRGGDIMDLDQLSIDPYKHSSTQPETPVNDMLLDWERPPRAIASERWSASQPTHAGAGANHSINTTNLTNGSSLSGHGVWDRLAEDPTMSQFAATQGVSLSLTQRAKRFQDIVPSHSLTRFFSHLPHNFLLPLIAESLQRLGVPTATLTQSALAGRDAATWIKIQTIDGRHCWLKGDVVVERTGIEGYQPGEELLEVRFVKTTGDPLEWRRFFKKVVVYCKDGVFLPDDADRMAL
ncbi:MAG: 60S ribosomal protein L31 [Chaenotheca gracillima]|nr:MAG: 60S ribosomal protein L31 [Chaenotheca gracillima]